MLIARVIGELVSTHKHKSHVGRKALIVQPLDLDGTDRGDAVIAFDAVDAGVGDRVLLVERANHRRAELLKETEIGVLVFDRQVGYDPKVDSIVRTEATRLRRKLSEYYAGEGRSSPYRLHLAPGRYVIEVLPNVQPVSVEAQGAEPPPRRRSLLYLGVVVALVKMRKPRGKPLMASNRSAGPSGRPAATSVTAPISKRGSAPSMRRSAPSLSTSSMNSRKSLYIRFAPAALDACAG